VVKEGMTTNEMNRKAQWVADMMKADGVTPEQVTPELSIAYMQRICKKIEAIQNTYLTRVGAKEAMQDMVASVI